MSTPRAVITGIGAVSPFGVGREVYWDHLARGVSGTRAITAFDATPFACRVAAPVPDEVLDEVTGPGGHAPERAGPSANGNGRADPRRYAKVSRIAVLAAREALDDSGLDPRGLDVGVVVGSGAGGIDVAERQYGDYFSGARHRVSPYAIPVSIVGIVSSEVSIALGLRGMSHVLSTGCTSSTDALGYAAALIRAGDADALVTGGADACATPGMIFGFSRMRAVSTAFNDRPAEASRPFDRGRDGFVLGEGAWMFILEREDRARARGARIYAVIEGYASTCDAYHRVQMDPDGAEIVRAITLALARAGRAPEAIGYVNFHGTSTQLNDAVESRCVREVFGAHADRLAGSSTKSMIGHPQGASGAAGVAATALAFARGVLPPTINLTDPDPSCDLDFIPNHARAVDVEAALCNCLGFGSKNSALVLGRPGPGARVGSRARRCDDVLDVLVAGAGPAGATAALLLARAGARVVIVDRETFPRDKLCGDTLNPGAIRLLARLGLSGGALGDATPLAGMRVSGPGAEVEARYPAGQVGLAIPRRRFDAWLLEQAIAAGARFEPGLRVLGPLVEGEDGRPPVRGLVVRRAGQASSTRLPASLTIGADGRRSVVGRALGLSVHPFHPRRWAFGTYVAGVAGVSDVGEMHLRPWGYCGVAPMPDGRVNVCVVTGARPVGRSPVDVIGRLIASDPRLAPRFAGVRFDAPVQVLGPLAVDVRMPGTDGLLLAGDAAGFVDPMTGDGLHLAMRGGELAAGVALETLERSAFGEAALALARRRQEHLGAKLRFNRALRGLVDHPSAVTAAAWGARLAPGIVRRAVRYAGDAA
ncbi:MAG: beta-ketoacyl-ACP synthase II [Vicinamibacterales bacterium]